MKRILSFIAAVMFVGQTLAQTQTTFEVNGLKYTVTDEQNGYVSVAKGSREPSGTLNIESKVTYRNKKYLVTSIPDNAFSGCTRITSATIPESVTSISEGAFNGCSGLTSISLPFAGCQPCYQLIDLSAPYDINQYLFCRIFGTSYYPGGTEIPMPTELETFFYIPTSLKEVTITGDSYIPYATFFGCRTLTSIIIGNNVPCVDGDAFGGCSNLTSVTIGSSVTTIIEGGLLYDGGWFASCNNLTTINVNTENAVYSSKDGVLFNKDQTTLICCPNGKTEYTIPNTVTSIGSDAFGYECGLTSLTIPESVTDIDNNAFQNYHTDFFVDGNINNIVLRLTSITINSDADFSNANLCFSKDGIFYRVLNKSSVEVRSKMESHGTAINYYIGEISIPNKVIAGNEFNVIRIGEYAFVGCSNLTSVTIPNSVTNISKGTFTGCSSLTSISLPFVGDRAHAPNDTYQYPFGYIFGADGHEGEIATPQYNPSTSSTTIATYFIPTSLKEVIITGSEHITKGAFVNCNNLTSVTIPNSVTSIGQEAFAGCCSLTSITIPNSVTSIGQKAFEGCRGLASVNFGNSVSSIGYGAFSDCTGLTTVAIPNSVTSIGSSAFSYCSGLTLVTISNSMTSISSNAFNGCSSLTSITIPESVTSIGDQAFHNCSGLTEVIIGNSVTSIGERVFYGCNGLTSVTIPNLVTSISSTAFYGCGGLTEINVESSNMAYTSENGILFNKDKTAIVCYPANKSEATYIIPSSVANISDYAFCHCGNLTSVTIPNSVTSIESSAFEECTSLSTVTIPNSVTSIESSAFEECTSLSTVTISNSVTSIGEGAFRGCIGLTEVIIGNSVTTIGSFAFYGCSGLPLVTIPNSVTSIGICAFFGCKDLRSVTIPNSVESIGDAAFYGCIGLTSICYEGSSEPTYQSYSFNNVDKTIPVCVPADYVSDSWCGFTNLYKGHDKVTDNAVAATCTETGLTEGSHCSKCGKILIAQEVIPASHTYCTAIIAPTCTAVGYATHTCSVCEFTYNSDTVDAKGHKADSVEFENIVPATCTAAGSKDSVVFCSVCQVELSREEKEIPTLDHTYSTTVTDPTCTEIGYTTHTCSVCNHTYNSDTVAANGHTEVIDAAIAATCTITGKTEGKHCSVCNTVLVPQEEVAALGHKFEKYTYNNDATTAADGTETATCERGCGATDTRTATGTKLPEPEKGTAVAESAANAVAIYAHHNIIVVENATDEIFVYNAMGTLVCRDVACRVRAEINVSVPGIYIVKVGGMAKRVMVN